MRFPVLPSMRSHRARIIMRILGYGAILDVFVMLWLDWQPRGSLTTMLAAMLLFGGWLALILLLFHPETRRREGWIICVTLWTLLLALVVPVLRVD
jgi:hypothetical protein